VICPLCGEWLDTTIADHRVSAKWHEALDHRDKWAEVAEQFRLRQSVEAAAEALAIAPALAEMVLRFLCLEMCGCRAATCVSCLDDYRSLL
jgi:hypothetical protein